MPPKPAPRTTMFRPWTAGAACRRLTRSARAAARRARVTATPTAAAPAAAPRPIATPFFIRSLAGLFRNQEAWGGWEARLQVIMEVLDEEKRGQHTMRARSGRGSGGWRLALLLIGCLLGAVL